MSEPSLSPDWRCRRCGTSSPSRHFPPCAEVFIWNGVESRACSPMLGLLHLFVPIAQSVIAPFRARAAAVMRGAS